MSHVICFSCTSVSESTAADQYLRNRPRPSQPCGPRASRVPLQLLQTRGRLAGLLLSDLWGRKINLPLFTARHGQTNVLPIPSASPSLSPSRLPRCPPDHRRPGAAPRRGHAARRRPPLPCLPSTLRRCRCHWAAAPPSPAPIHDAGAPPFFFPCRPPLTVAPTSLSARPRALQ